MYLCTLQIMHLINKMKHMLKILMQKMIIMEVNKDYNLYLKEYNKMVVIHNSY